ncbi:helix-turn-helix domain-containing protein [Bacteroides uniformis]|uniref:Helix-turn-helix domain-containing protein n=2 Tax=Bacteroides TaxID=816 RepID=A0ABR7C356_9BACE|nr:helix-turn-helix domain-containing protein [Bacteroides parvus]
MPEDVERIDRLSVMIDGISRDGGIPPKEDVYLCDKEVACMLKVSRRTLGEYRSNGTLPYYILGGKVLYKRSEIKQGLNREYKGVGKTRGSG